MILGRFRFHSVVIGVLLAAALAACVERADADRAAEVEQPRSLVVDAAASSLPAGRAVVALDPADRTRRFSVGVSGDILIHESVWESARSYAGGGDDFDFGPMFEPVAPFIEATDLSLCHLEVPLSGDNSHLASFPRFSAPHQLADAIAGAGFDGCSFASNHVLDRGVTGIHDTLDHLDRVGLGHAGAARTPEEAETITTYEVRGVRIAHLSYTYGYNGLVPPAGEEWRSNLIDPVAILDEASRARAEGAEVVLVSLHWGAEYVHTPNQYQLDVAAAVAPSPDVDLVIGHHAHVIQPVDVVGDTWVIYGVGNFLSNMLQPERRDGVIVTAHFEARPGEPFEVVEVDYLPTQVEIPGHRIVPAPPESWERTSSFLRSRGADLTTAAPD